MKLKNILATALIPFNILLLFFLIFSNQLVIPTWLQVLGRMHPVILHFPIVLVLIYFAIVLIIPKKNISELWYIELTEWLLLSGAFTAVLTALMGMFLSREGGYDEDSIVAHKYLGSIISFLLFIIYFSRNFLKQQQILFKLSAACSAIVIVWAGHLGGDITHGENFVLAPVTPSHIKPQVGFNDAFIYADLVEPILQTK